MEDLPLAPPLPRRARASTSHTVTLPCLLILRSSPAIELAVAIVGRERQVDLAHRHRRVERTNLQRPSGDQHFSLAHRRAPIELARHTGHSWESSSPLLAPRREPRLDLDPELSVLTSPHRVGFDSSHSLSSPPCHRPLFLAASQRDRGSTRPSARLRGSWHSFSPRSVPSTVGGQEEHAVATSGRVDGRRAPSPLPSHSPRPCCSRFIVSPTTEEDTKTRTVINPLLTVPTTETMTPSLGEQRPDQHFSTCIAFPVLLLSLLPGAQQEQRQEQRNWPTYLALFELHSFGEVVQPVERNKPATNL